MDATKLYEALDDPDTMTISLTNGEGTFHFGKMYESPELTEKHLNAIRDFFGLPSTANIDHYGTSERGCETCDFGSDYGWDFSITGASINADCRLELHARNNIKEAIRNAKGLQ